MADYIPRTDAVFQTWQDNFKAYAVANAVALGLSPADVIELTTKAGTWTASWTGLLLAKASAETAVADKNDARDDYTVTIRKLVAVIQANPAVTDGQRAALQITIPKERETIPPPSETPGIFIDFSVRLAHVIHWGPTPQYERTNAKPAGVASCEIRRFVGQLPPEMNQENFEFVAIDTMSPYVANMSAHAGQLIHWTCRYLNAKGEPGFWSAIITAEVTV